MNDSHSGQRRAEPWWVVVAEFGDEDYASTTVDAPTADEAEAQGERVIVGGEGKTPRRIARVTGPFPKEVETAERENRPKGCHGCGLKRWCGNHPPTPTQTWFDPEDRGESVAHQCIQCKTLTVLPKESLA